MEVRPIDVEMQILQPPAIRLIHTPTQTVVDCYSEPTQFENRELALKRLKSILEKMS